ncbi:AEC family transporter [Cohaesibacter intestini]|uniref:AEC family transporter n=1 Tax=Cohaesibacter intestini TaxID=2211145 RepID=UPI000DEAAC8A|nr:AEC family transporter [Cohaesibacter intestini]
MLLILEAMIPTFCLVALGLYIRRSEMVPENQWNGLETLSYWLFFPALIFHSLVSADLKNVPLGEMAGALITTLVVMALILLVAYPMMKSALSLDGPAYTSIYQSVLRWNGFIALSIVQKAYGTDAMALVAVAMATMIPVINVIVVTILATFASKSKPQVASVLMNILKNPLIWASAGGLVFNMLEIPIWDAIGTTIEVTARAGLATGLLIVGAGLKLRYLFPPSLFNWIGTLWRLIAMPALALGVGLIFGLEGEVLEIAVICMAVPTAMNGYILAKKMGGDAELLNGMVTLQTGLAVLTIPLWLLIIRSFITG